MGYIAGTLCHDRNLSCIWYTLFSPNHKSLATQPLPLSLFQLISVCILWHTSSQIQHLFFHLSARIWWCSITRSSLGWLIYTIDTGTCDWMSITCLTRWGFNFHFYILFHLFSLQIAIAFQLLPGVVGPWGAHWKCMHGIEWRNHNESFEATEICWQKSRRYRALQYLSSTNFLYHLKCHKAAKPIFQSNSPCVLI